MFLRRTSFVLSLLYPFIVLLTTGTVEAVSREEVAASRRTNTSRLLKKTKSPKRTKAPSQEVSFLDDHDTDHDTDHDIGHDNSNTKIDIVGVYHYTNKCDLMFQASIFCGNVIKDDPDLCMYSEFSLGQLIHPDDLELFDDPDSCQKLQNDDGYFKPNEDLPVPNGEVVEIDQDKVCVFSGVFRRSVALEGNLFKPLPLASSNGCKTTTTNFELVMKGLFLDDDILEISFSGDNGNTWYTDDEELCPLAYVGNKMKDNHDHDHDRTLMHQEGHFNKASVDWEGWGVWDDEHFKEWCAVRDGYSRCQFNRLTAKPTCSSNPIMCGDTHCGDPRCIEYILKVLPPTPPALQLGYTFPYTEEQCRCVAEKRGFTTTGKPGDKNFGSFSKTHSYDQLGYTPGCFTFTEGPNKGYAFFGSGADKKPMDAGLEKAKYEPKRDRVRIKSGDNSCFPPLTAAQCVCVAEKLGFDTGYTTSESRFNFFAQPYNEDHDMYAGCFVVGNDVALFGLGADELQMREPLVNGLYTRIYPNDIDDCACTGEYGSCGVVYPW